MVEAAGVEPASERPVATELYMRSRASNFTSGVEVRRNRRTLGHSGSRRRAPGARASLLKWRSFPTRRLTGRTSQLIRLRVQAACSQLRVLSTGLTSEMNKLGTHPAVPCAVEAKSPPQGVTRRDTPLLSHGRQHGPCCVSTPPSRSRR